MNNNQNHIRIRNTDQETDKDFNLMLKRITIVGFIALFAFGVIHIVETVYAPENDINYTVNESITDTVYVRTIDAVTTQIVINYQFSIQPNRLDNYYRKMYDENKRHFYKRIIYYPVADGLKTKALEYNFDQPDILKNFRDMVRQTIQTNLRGINWESFDFTISYDPRVLKLLEQRKQAAQNVYQTQKELAEAEAYARRMIDPKSKDTINGN